MSSRKTTNVKKPTYRPPQHHENHQLLLKEITVSTATKHQRTTLERNYGINSNNTSTCDNATAKTQAITNDNTSKRDKCFIKQECIVIAKQHIREFFFNNKFLHHVRKEKEEQQQQRM